MKKIIASALLCSIIFSNVAFADFTNLIFEDNSEKIADNSERIAELEAQKAAIEKEIARLKEEDGIREETASYEDGKVKIQLNGINEVEDRYSSEMSYELEFLIENMDSKKTYRFSLSELSINDYMIDTFDDVHGDAIVSPGKKAVATFYFEEKIAKQIPMESIEAVETKFLVMDNDELLDYYYTDMFKFM